MSAAQFRACASERSIQSGIVDLLRLVGVPHSVTDAAMVVDRHGRSYGQKVRTGWPDISAVIGPAGKGFFIETKSAKGKLSLAQIKCHAWLRSSGAQVLVARSVQEVALALVSAGLEHPALSQVLHSKK